MSAHLPSDQGVCGCIDQQGCAEDGPCYDPRHPHEPEIPPVMAEDGHCRVCRLIVERDGLRGQIERLRVDLGRRDDALYQIRKISDAYEDHVHGVAERSVANDETGEDRMSVIAHDERRDALATAMQGALNRAGGPLLANRLIYPMVDVALEAAHLESQAAVQRVTELETAITDAWEHLASGHAEEAVTALEGVASPTPGGSKAVTVVEQQARAAIRRAAPPLRDTDRWTIHVCPDCRHANVHADTCRSSPGEPVYGGDRVEVMRAQGTN